MHMLRAHVSGPIEENSTRLTFYRVAPISDSRGVPQLCRVTCEVETAAETVWYVQDEVSMPVTLVIRPFQCYTHYEAFLKQAGPHLIGFLQVRMLVLR